MLEKLIISRCAKTKSHFLTFGFCNITKKLFLREIQFHISINNQLDSEAFFIRAPHNKEETNKR